MSEKRVVAQSREDESARTGYLTREVSENLIKEIENFDEENRRLKLPAFYKSPTLRQYWGEEQEDVESWKEIFFDLIFVAVAFQLGKVLEELIKEDGGSQSGLYFMAQFLPLFSLWQMRMYYLSRFNASSYFHSILDIIYATLIALMALFIGKRSEIEATIGGIDKIVKEDILDDINISRFLAEEEEKSEVKEKLGFNTALAFTCCAFIATLISTFRALETTFIIPKYGIRRDIEDDLREEEQAATRASGIWDIVRSALFAGCIGLSFMGAYFGNEALFIIGLYLGFFSVLGFFTLYVVIRAVLGLERQKLIPINVGFALKRQGEFLMLMLGEGVLQIIITDIGEDLDGHLKTFVFAFLLLSFLYLLAFFGLPYEPNDSAFRKSSVSALIIGFIKPLEYSGFIGIGVSLKLLLEVQDELDEEEDERESLSLFLTFTVLWFLLDRMLNHGYWEIFKRDFSAEGKQDKSWSNIHFERIIFSVLFCTSPLIYLSLTYIEMDGPQFLLIALALCFVIFLFGLTEYKWFLRHVEEEHAHDEVELVPDEVFPEENSKRIASEEINSKRILSSMGNVSSSMRSNKKDGFKLLTTLQYLRKKTRLIDIEIKSACEHGNFHDYQWEHRVRELEKLVNIVDSTFECYERKIAAKRADI